MATRSSDPILVHKYGGSSVADVEKIKRVAALIARRRAEGFGLVVVVSAMGDTTDELLALAKQVTPNPTRRELDMLLSAGERISMALLSMALNDGGTPAISFTGSQSGIITTDDHARARIVEVRPMRVRAELDLGKVVIVAGYQGVSLGREVTTLGRGGSDTSAVAMAAALEAQACEICSDVDGVFSADPRLVRAARKLEALGYEEMQALAQAGAKVLGAPAVEFARSKGIALHARSTFGGGTGTLICATPGTSAVCAIATDAEVAWVEAERAIAPEAVTALLESRGVTGHELERPGARRAWAVSTADLHDGTFGAALALRFGDAVALRQGVARVAAVGRGAGEREVEAVLRASAAEAGAELLGLERSALSTAVWIAREHLAAVACAAHQRLIERPGERVSA